MSLDLVRWLDLPTYADAEGALTVAQYGGPLPFTPQRLFYLYDISGGATRGAHSHKVLEQVIVTVTGSIKLKLDDGHKRQEFHLNDPTKAIYMPAGIWGELTHFSPGTVVVVLASLPYDEKDYIRNYNDFIEYTRKK